MNRREISLSAAVLTGVAIFCLTFAAAAARPGSTGG